VSNFIENYLPDTYEDFKEEILEKCAGEFNIPLNSYCPFQLRDLG